jgi:type 2 lantibiotic biosynthesis protein LanM
MFGLLTLAKPLIARGMSKLKEGAQSILRKHPRPPLDLKITERVFLTALERQLLTMLSKVAILELNVARVEGSLNGRTQEERYRSFVRRLGQRETAVAMLLEYPVLARQLVLRIDQWIGFVLEFVDRLCADWPLISQILVSGDVEPGLLTHVQMDAGDRHRGGRCVVIATFASGFKLVYKPKSMSVDSHFQELLRWVNARGSHPLLRTLTILDRGCYGWSEFVAARSCHSPDEIRRFYERQGAYLALLYLLEATDFHSENIIAAGEDPVLVDLEAIFHPRFNLSEQRESPDSSVLSHSALRVGILPWQSFANETTGRFDISGLGGSAGQLTPHKIAYWENVGTDEMKLSRRQMPIPGSGNRPRLNEHDVSPVDYMNEISKGFTSVYLLLMKNRDALIAQDGPLLHFADDEVRVIFRPTKTYGVLLQESFHPDVLRDALERDQLFDRLWIAVEALPYLATIVTDECADLQNGDIPFFSTRPRSLHVWSSTNKCIPNFLQQSALSLVERRLHEMDEANLSLQLWLIRASLATTVVEYSPTERDHTAPAAYHREPADRARLLSAVCTLGNKLESSAIRWNDNASWIGLGGVHERQWGITAATLDLYDGLPGIAFFLAYLGKITGESRYTDLARATCNTMLHRSGKYGMDDMCIGAFAGWGGIIYVLTHLSSLWSDSTLLRRAEEIAQDLSSGIAGDEDFDIIAGSAGCIGSLLTLYRQSGSPDALATAKACGDHLVARAKSMPNGVGWIIPKQTTPLCGFAHGAAGISWALFQLSELTGNNSFRKTADAAVSYERSLFDCETANWPDLRAGLHSPAETGKSSMSAWCHGAAGIGLSRLASERQQENDHARVEIDAALSTTFKTGFGHGHSMCHGDVGNLELFLQASRVLKNEQWNLRALEIASGVAERVLHDDYGCGTPLHVDSPGLMSGISGIGYGLLRLAEPDWVPSVLTLQPAAAA